MSLGKKIAAARQAKGLSQAALAEILDVSPEAVSKWEQDAYHPSKDRLGQLEEMLNLSAFDEEGNPLDGRLFDEKHMSAFLKGRLKASDLSEASRALAYAKEKHEGAFRKPVEKKIPYIIHPMTLACHALALGIEDDALLSALLLHDVAEDCGIKVEEMPFSSEVRELVALVTKPAKSFDEAAYYDSISKNSKACLIKCLDRCNNLSGMAAGFSAGKIAEYVKETEAYYPTLLRVVKSCPPYNNAAWLLEYHIRSLLAMAKRIT